MNSQTTSRQSFQSDYALLQLDEYADWTTARASYRRLVHLWHPDKFILRPDERPHAQLQFINLTKSYNALRNFYKINGCLPLQNVAATAQKGTGQSAKADAFKPAPKTRDKRHNSQAPRRTASGREVDRSTAGRRKKTTWIASGALMMIATIVFFLFQDSNATKARLELGREVVRQTPASEFLTDNDKIRKSQAREALLKPPR